MHICGDEIIAAAAVLPFLGAGCYWLKEKCGLGCKYTPDTHECGTCEPEHEGETEEGLT